MRELDDLIDDIDKLVDWQMSESPAARAEFGGELLNWWGDGTLQSDLHITVPLWLPSDDQSGAATLTFTITGSDGLMNVPVLPGPL